MAAVEVADDVPPLKNNGPAPNAAWNKGPYPGAPAELVHDVMYVVNANVVFFRMLAVAPGNVRVPVLSLRVGASTFC
jgi:hypothetical protein